MKDPEPLASRLVGRTALLSFTGFLISCALALVTTTLSFTVTASAFAARVSGLQTFSLAAVVICFGVLFFDLMVLYRFFVPPRDVSFRSLAGSRIHVGLTAYNDEECIGQAVREFKSNPVAHRVIVVENNSRDRTREVAEAAGADEVVTEPVPGYGSCCMRAMAEAAKDADVIVLCEGDMTFSSRDLSKMLAYLENCDLVLGTRATQELRENGTQMDWLINPANQIVAKLIQVRFWGTRLTDVGCTYRAIRTDAYRRLAPNLHVRGNHFSPHMFIEALKLGMRVIEIPVVFRRRVGVSKGVGSNKLKAAVVARAMLSLLFRA